MVINITFPFGKILLYFGKFFMLARMFSFLLCGFIFRVETDRDGNVFVRGS